MKQLLSIFLLCLLFSAARAQDYDIGTFYMPFWRASGDNMLKGNWKIINNFNQESIANGYSHETRTPIRYQSQHKFYNEDDPAVTSAQMKIMKDYGIDYVVFDSYWEWTPQHGFGSYWQHALDNVLTQNFNFHGRKFAIRWSSDFTTMVAQLPDDKQANPEGCRGFFKNGGGMDQLVADWKKYMTHPNYKRIDGKPVIYMGLVGITEREFFNPNDSTESLGKYTNTIEGLCGICTDDQFFTSFDLLPIERYESGINAYKTRFFMEKFEEKIGFEIYWVAAFTPPADDYKTSTSHHAVNWDWYHDFPKKAEFDAVSSYTHKYYENKDIYNDWEEDQDANHCRDKPGEPYPKRWDHYDYNYMSKVYKKFWDFFVQNRPGQIKYHVPATAGWNRASLNFHEWSSGEEKHADKGCTDNNHKFHNYDQAFSTPATFEAHLRKAKDYMDRYPTLTDRRTMICCWNEYAEGTIIEPTLEFQYAYVDAINRVFNNPGNGGGPIPMGLRAEPEVEDTGTVVYPNPVEDIMSVDLTLENEGPLQIRIYDMSGALSKSLDLDLERGKSSVQVNVFDLTPGLYNVCLITEAGETVKKVQIK